MNMILFLFFCFSVFSYYTKSPVFFRGHDVDGTVWGSFKDTSSNPVDYLNGFNQPFKNSGFIEVNSSTNGNLYYVYFPAKDGNKNAKTIIWLQGGPGSSSISNGLFNENGPYFVDGNLQLQENKWSWNTHYNVIYVDQPVGTGFSYTDEGGYCTTLEQTTIDLYTFLLKFVDIYPEIGSSTLYIFGESYGGKYAPSLAHHLLLNSKHHTLTLGGVAIGDGACKPEVQMTSYSKFAAVNSIVGDSDLEKLGEMEAGVVKLIEDEQWESAIEHIETILDFLSEKGGGVSQYDIREFGDYDFSSTVKFLNLAEVKKEMHTQGKEFKEVSSKVYSALHQDMPKSVMPIIQDLLRKNVSVTFYNGQFDMIVVSDGTLKILHEMEWKYQNEFVKSERKIWKFQNKDNEGKEITAGFIKEYENLRFIVLIGAGHLSPMDQPEATFRMVQGILENEF